MRGWLSALAVLLATLCAAPGAPAQPGEARIALIIANDAYVSAALGRLPGTQRDAAVMRTALQSAGFQVTVRANLSRVQMRAELSAFARQLRELGPRGVGFLYFSGHGVADSARGQNYLIPIDAEIADITDLPTNGLAMNEELDAIELAGAHATIVVIDACRNTIRAIGRSATRGLAAVPARTDTLVAFSTQPNETAADDGLYARSLAAELTAPGADSITVFARVQQRVATATQRRQVPRYDNGLVEPVVFALPAAATRLAVQPQSDASTSPPAVTSEAAARMGQAIGAAIAEQSARNASAGSPASVVQNDPSNISDEQLSAALARPGRGWIGIQVQPLTEDIASSLNLPSSHGALIISVLAGGPAQLAGVLIGDAILAYEGHDIVSPRDLTYRILQTDAGARVALNIYRFGERRTLYVTLVNRPAEESLVNAPRPQPDIQASSGTPIAALALSVRPLTTADEAYANGRTGLMITSLTPNSAAASSGLSPGDLIMSASGRPVRSLRDFEGAIDESSRAGRPLLMHVGMALGDVFVTLRPAPNRH